VASFFSAPFTGFGQLAIAGGENFSFGAGQLVGGAARAGGSDTGLGKVILALASRDVPTLPRNQSSIMLL